MTKPLARNESWHGTQGGYTNHACRCDACRTAHAAYLKAYNQRPDRKAHRKAYYANRRRLAALAIVHGLDRSA